MSSALKAMLVALLSIAALGLAEDEGQARTMQAGVLVITPSSGPVGTTVQLSGQGCNYPGNAPVVGFQGISTGGGTFGSAPVLNIVIDAGDKFSVTFVIPAEIGTIQGQGGGIVLPGRYYFASHPPFCVTDFTVTGPAGLAETGGQRHSPRGDGGRTYALLGGLMLVTLGVFALFGHRRCPRIE